MWRDGRMLIKHWTEYDYTAYSRIHFCIVIWSDAPGTTIDFEFYKFRFVVAKPAYYHIHWNGERERAPHTYASTVSKFDQGWKKTITTTGKEEREERGAAESDVHALMYRVMVQIFYACCLCTMDKLPYAKTSPLRAVHIPKIDYDN